MDCFVAVCLAFIVVSCVGGEDVCKSQRSHQQEASNDAKSTSSITKYTIGDPRNCLRGDDKDLLRLEVLPGTGWDNLRNLQMGMVIWKNYSQCMTTEDGRYLIPDNTYVIPLKESNVLLNSEYFDHWNNYSSMTSTTVNAGGHASFFGVSLGGKFSSEYESVKKHQVEDKAITTRVQLRYRFYTVHAEPDMQLHPDCKSRLLDIAAHMQCNNMAMARYLAGMFVRDYGTHYVTSIDAGAILAKVDHVKSKIVENEQMDRSTITASASASFFGAFGFSASYTHRTKQEDIDTYKSYVANSKILTFGGPPFRANFSVDQWEDGLPNNLVGIDRSGDPLHYAITPQTLPELPEELTLRLSEFVLKSIRRYYKHNAIKGCTDASSPNFNFQANLDDHSCKSPYTNFTFGGVYQTCSVSGSPTNNPCPTFEQKNPKTQDYACPDGYQSVLLHQGHTPTTCHRECHGWWIFKSCHNDCGYASYNTYWCVATGQVKDHSGFLFGGLYTSTAVNPVTGSASCPLKFYKQRFGPDKMYVCISDDYELASQFSLPFAGFFSCSAGDPLALTSNKGLTAGQGKFENFLYDAGPSSWPKRCPTGYTQHLAVVDEDCEINYCVKANALSNQGLPVIKRPPFSALPKMNYNITIPLSIVNDDNGKIWFKDPDSLNWMLATKWSVMKYVGYTDITKGAMENLKLAMSPDQQTASPASTDGSSDSMSSGTVAGIVIGAIALVAVMIVLVVIRNHRNGRKGKGVNREPFLTASAHYNAINSNTSIN